MNDRKKKNLIKKNSHLFWYIKKDSLDKINDEFLVETILNYGDWKSVQKLLEIFSIEKVAKIFFNQISQKRNNYKKPTLNFFKLYFNEHIQKRSIIKRSIKTSANNQKV
ncbi:hypothetical protein [Ignavibacterium sp.]|uniref:hypothetical protein n=1 Tax=Ignavibacterium sp. TaxID=2651167 RepID=UPI00262633E7|nr:hypothetical protein [Ignavibacterium sp.]